MSMISVHKHINSKKPVPFILHSSSSIIWPHFPPFLRVMQVGSPSLDWPRGVLSVALPVPFACLARTIPPVFLHWFKWGQVSLDHLPCRPIGPPDNDLLWKHALALSRLLSHLHKAPVSHIKGRGCIFPGNFSSFLLSLIWSSAPHTLETSRSSPKRVLAYFLSKPLYTAVPELVERKDLRVLWNVSNLCCFYWRLASSFGNSFFGNNSVLSTEAASTLPPLPAACPQTQAWSSSWITAHTLPGVSHLNAYRSLRCSLAQCKPTYRQASQGLHRRISFKHRPERNRF